LNNFVEKSTAADTATGTAKQEAEEARQAAKRELHKACTEDLKVRRGCAAGHASLLIPKRGDDMQAVLRVLGRDRETIKNTIEQLATVKDGDLQSTVVLGKAWRALGDDLTEADIKVWFYSVVLRQAMHVTMLFEICRRWRRC
jgi:hypothetical protein